MACKLYLSEKGRVILPNGNESILFNSLYDILGNYEKSLDIYEVVDTPDFKDYSSGYIAQNRADRSVVKRATPSSIEGMWEVYNTDSTVKILYSETESSVVLDTIESKDLGKGKAREFLKEFLDSFPSKDIETTIEPKSSGTTYQGLASLFESMGFEYKNDSDVEMVRTKNKDDFYPDNFDQNGEPSVEVLSKYIIANSDNKASKREVLDFMKAKGIYNTDDALTALKRLYVDGIPVFTSDNLRKVGIFDAYDIHNIQKSETSQREIEGIFNYLVSSDYMEVSDDNVEFSGDMIAGSVVGVVPTIIDSETSTIIDGNVVPTRGGVVNVDMSVTINDELNQTLSEDIAFLRQISEDTWDNNLEYVGEILGSIEESAKINGVSLVGLRELSLQESRDTILDLLDELETAITTGITTKLQSSVDSILGLDYQQAPFELNEGEFYFKFPVNEEYAFNELSLIKISDNLYRKVYKMSTPEILATISAKTGVPVSVVEKSALLEKDLSISEPTISEQIYLHKVANGVNEFKPSIAVDKITSEEVSEYYQQRFETDFAQWLIDNNNTDFTVDSSGIKFTNPYTQVESYNRLPKYLRDGLVEYSKISKTLELPFVESTPSVENGDIFIDRTRVISNPSIVKPYTGDYTVQGDFIVVKNAVDNFINIRGTIYEIVSESGNVSFYSKVEQSNSKYIEPAVSKPMATNSILGLNVSKDTATPVEVAENLTQEELTEINEQHFECE